MIVGYTPTMAEWSTTVTVSVWRWRGVKRRLHRAARIRGVTLTVLSERRGTQVHLDITAAGGDLAITDFDYNVTPMLARSDWHGDD